MSTEEHQTRPLDLAETTSLLADLVRIESVNPDLVPGGVGESEIASYVAGWLRDRGLDVDFVVAAPGRPSVVATARGIGGGRSLMLNAHIDTVGTAGMEDPFSARVEDGRLYGRGSYDMKGGLAAVMLAAAAAAHEGLPGDVIVTAVADEEYASLGVQTVLAELSADAAIVTEPTGLGVCVAHKGFVWFEISVTGRAAHGSQPHKGHDAIAAMGVAQVGIVTLDAALAEHKHPLLGRASIHASLIRGGQELSSYPESCVLGVERRTLPGESEDIVEAEIDDLAKLIAAGTDCSASTEMLLWRAPFEIDEQEPIVKTLLTEAAGVIGTERPITGENPWMDAAFLTAAGIPTVVFGPGGDGAHGLVEWVEISDVEQCAEALFRTACSYCS